MAIETGSGRDIEVPTGRRRTGGGHLRRTGPLRRAWWRERGVCRAGAVSDARRPERLRAGRFVKAVGAGVAASSSGSIS
ncbi:MAG: hypothetical protein D6725_06025, partial [Planctomycetota bacterium]